MTTFSTDPALYIFTSLTAGSSHIVTATSRLETILRANRVPFKAVDLATDQKARMLWGRRAGKDASGRVRKLPGLAQEGLILGDLVEIEDWNEYGELKQHVKIYYDEFTIPTIHNKPKDPPKRFVHPITGAPMKGGSKAGSKAAAGAAAAAAAAASASSSSSAKPAAPPAAPPLPPADEKKAATAAPAKKAETGEKVTMPIRSIADEAAQKAKDLRLAALRAKVHGSKAKAEEKAKAEASTKEAEDKAAVAKPEDKAAVAKAEDKAAVAKTEDKAVEEKKTEDKPTAQTETKPTEQDTTAEKEAEAKPAPTTPAKAAAASTSTSSLATTTSSSAPGGSSSSISAFRAATALQSPTRTTWVPASPASTDALRETLQSPTTARWKAAATFEAPAASHMGAALAAASQEDIAAIEKAEAIPEEDEDEDDEDEEEEEE
ncbi:hypothetical protein ACHAO5_006638 [Verticillium nonalfalfae]